MIYRLLFIAVCVLIALLCLYLLTRNRWDWSQYARPIAITASVLLIIPLGLFAWTSYENRLQPLGTFAGVELGSNSKQVKYVKGEPFSSSQNELGQIHWRYNDPISPGNFTDILFRDNKVVEISFSGTCEYCHLLSGFGLNSTYSEIKNRFGESADIKSTQGGTQSRVNYPKYQVFFILEGEKVVRQGIYQ